VELYLYCPYTFTAFTGATLPFTFYLDRDKRGKVYETFFSNSPEHMLSAVRRRSEGDIQMDHRAVLCYTTNWTELTEDMIQLWTSMNMTVNLRRLQTSGIL
jgi:hypothetical protein